MQDATSVIYIDQQLFTYNYARFAGRFVIEEVDCQIGNTQDFAESGIEVSSPRD